MTLQENFNSIRAASEAICRPLLTEDYSVQPSTFASPPKWHLAHVTWFWEQFVLTEYLADYAVFHEDFSFLFNSYYNNVGKRVLRPVRGLMTRPSVEEVYRYRAYVNESMNKLFEKEVSDEVKAIIEIGLNHEQQHQELLVYDIKYILGNQPTFPAYLNDVFTFGKVTSANKFHKIEAGIYKIGHDGNGFAFDNEFGRHKTYIQDFEIADDLVSNAEYLEFITAGGYSDFNFWHDEGWQWVTENAIKAPMYWHEIEGTWHYYDLGGLRELAADEPVRHISFYEAFAFAQWKGMRLPTEAEWEVASSRFDWGQLWEWTNSAYLAYPGYVKQPGAIGEYNGKFMVNQMVLRGASVATPKGHSRKTYRNFFHADMRWQYNGIRLVK
ncbi:ergothioneine biosynthesis protein EgtB [Flavobacterium sp.]|uniref:ergothioneine biosynthesis protein EgtB n=1 Tax=Flavobacterium sp. TaxID=239 RepID=UPI00121E2A06|nr:ergothioneine biosynthesis protein EgtB [Flavobacterium sp.]RZJ70748.1 MAG: ergothioneine biosynthesis protein EgtB [Flavobacterium sp.]